MACSVFVDVVKRVSEEHFELVEPMPSALQASFSKRDEEMSLSIRKVMTRTLRKLIVERTGNPNLKIIAVLHYWNFSFGPADSETLPKYLILPLRNAKGEEAA